MANKRYMAMLSGVALTGSLLVAQPAAAQTALTYPRTEVQTGQTVTVSPLSNPSHCSQYLVYENFDNVGVTVDDNGVLTFTGGEQARSHNVAVACANNGGNNVVRTEVFFDVTAPDSPEEPTDPEAPVVDTLRYGELTLTEGSDQIAVALPTSVPTHCTQFKVDDAKGLNATVNPEGVVTVRVGDATPGRYLVDIACTDDVGGNTNVRFGIVAVNVLPKEAVVADLGYAGSELGQNQTATYSPNNPVEGATYRLAGAAPEGWSVSVSEADGKTTVNPQNAEPGVYTLRIEAVNDQNEVVGNGTLAITIRDDSDSDETTVTALTYLAHTLYPNTSVTYAPATKPADDLVSEYRLVRAPEGWYASVNPITGNIMANPYDAAPGEYEIVVEALGDDGDVLSTGVQKITVPSEDDDLPIEGGSAPSWLLPILAGLGLTGVVLSSGPSSALISSTPDGENGDNDGDDDGDNGGVDNGDDDGDKPTDDGSADGSDLGGSALLGSALLGSSLLGSSGEGSVAAPDGSAGDDADATTGGTGDTAAEATERGEVTDGGNAGHTGQNTQGQAPATGPVAGQDVKAAAQAQAANAPAYAPKGAATQPIKAEQKTAAQPAPQAQERQLANTGVEGTLLTLAAGLMALAAGALLVLRRRNV